MFLVSQLENNVVVPRKGIYIILKFLQEKKTHFSVRFPFSLEVNQHGD